MKRFSGLTWTGIITVVGGLLFYGTWVLWNIFAVARPVSMPVSLSVGIVRTPEFSVNVNRYYVINIEAKKRLSPDILDCMMGISLGPLDPYNCKEGKEPLLQANWTLWSGGQILYQGSSEDSKGHGGWTEREVQRDIGTFKGESGKKYILDVDFVKDGRALAVTDPHLNVEVAGSYYEDEMAMDFVLSLLLLPVEGIGLTLLIISARRYLRNRASREGSISSS